MLLAARLCLPLPVLRLLPASLCSSELTGEGMSRGWSHQGRTLPLGLPLVCSILLGMAHFLEGESRHVSEAAQH